jgi:hypothetical protein
MLSFFSALVSLCAFMISTVLAKDNSPANKSDCLAVSQTLYRQAERLSKRTKQIIPREFARVAANLDEFCCHFDTRDKFLKEAHRVLKPGVREMG